MPERQVPLAVGGFAYTSSVIDATGEKFAWVGRHWNSARATKSIRRAQFLFGTVTKAGGSGLTISLQDVDTANGPAIPDGTQDQTVAIANADASFASNTWYRTGAFSADRSVAFGALVAVVAEYDGSGRLGADAVNFNNLTSATDHGSTCSHFTASWANVPVLPNILLEYDDGTFGTLASALVASAVTSQGFANSSTPDEYALKFQVPFDCKIDELWFMCSAGANTRDFSILLENDSGNILSVAVDAHTIDSGSSTRIITCPITETSLTKNTNYYVSLRADTASNNTVSIITVNSAAHMDALWGGTTWHLATRTNAGAWSATTTQRPIAGIHVSQVHDGTGSGGSYVIGG